MFSALPKVEMFGNQGGQDQLSSLMICLESHRFVNPLKIPQSKSLLA
jgi:hypothetical protein